jgi:hypothetical protein
LSKNASLEPLANQNKDMGAGPAAIGSLENRHGQMAIINASHHQLSPNK